MPSSLQCFHFARAHLSKTYGEIPTECLDLFVVQRIFLGCPGLSDQARIARSTFGSRHSKARRRDASVTTGGRQQPRSCRPRGTG